MPRMINFNKTWLIDYRDWISFNSSMNEFWCRACKVSIKPKKYNVMLHAKRMKHMKKLKDFLAHSGALNPSKCLIQNVKTEKVVRDDGSYVLIQSEKGVPLNPESDEATLTTNLVSDHPCQQIVIQKSEEVLDQDESTDEGITALASTIGMCLIEDIEHILRSQPKFLKWLQDESLCRYKFSKESLPRLTRACVGHLAQKYLVESALDNVQKRSTPNDNKMTWKIKKIEDRLLKTITEMRELKKGLGSSMAPSVATPSSLDGLGDSNATLETTMPFANTIVLNNTFEEERGARSEQSSAKLNG